ncbi:DUF3017 domain-containing protein [Streptomyces sp. KCTC 0041BP]|uniref:DUF3017 domain-containing protein n=1 Tax=Streptomyces sp. KCTC 0041BP TaxID=201500 RepID=UPI001AE7DA63|nr:DUF3017 domain-containing protein [Streptomyces sp. KCTC 0041BP]MBP0935871.1 DUF3017 domain-containing protein [Streptomyces sp. KCTC 0041BP]
MRAEREHAGPAGTAKATGTDAAKGSGTAKATAAAEGSGAAEATDAAKGPGAAEATAVSDPAAAPDGAGAPEVTKAAPAATTAADAPEVTTAAATPAATATGGAKEARGTRRFPSITRDTARPEGGGRAAPRDASAPARQWPMLSVLAATAVGLLVTAVGHPRIGCLFIGVALIAAAVLRRVLPSVGMLAVRSRFTDMATYGVLGVAITLLALVMQPQPWLDIPSLESTVHFSIR